MLIKQKNQNERERENITIKQIEIEKNQLIRKTKRKTDCFGKVSCNPLLNKLPQDSMAVIKTLQKTFNY